MTEKKQSFSMKIKDKWSSLKAMGKNLDPTLPLEDQNNMTLKEYIALGLYKIGTQLVATNKGSKGSTFLYECYYQGTSVDEARIADIAAILTTITTVLTIFVALLAATVAFKWKSKKYGRYRQWFLIGIIPVAITDVLEFVIPNFGETGLIAFKYAIGIITVFTAAFFGLAANIIQVISPNVKEKKRVVTMNQLYYYAGYGLAYLFPFIFGLFTTRKIMYVLTPIVGTTICLVGSVLCFMWCRERIDLPMKKKERVTTASLKLFKYKNYIIYHLVNWVGTIAMTGTMMSYLAAIVVGTDKAILLTLPSAIGTAIGVVITGALTKKFSPVQLLKFDGIYTPVMGLLTFFSVFFTHEFGVLFYICYFLFGISFGIGELSKSHMDTEFMDFLEWKTGERLEAVQGVIPGWVTQALNYGKNLMIPFMLAWVGYETNKGVGDMSLMEYMKTLPTYDSTCLWVLAFAIFGVSISNFLRFILLTFGYDIDGEKKKQMYLELSESRKRARGEMSATAETAAECTEEAAV